MNKVELLARQSAGQESPGKSQRKRPPPQAVKVLLPVWGYSYVRQFLQCGLPTLLSPGNVPAVAAALPTEFVILTSVDDEPYIREHSNFKRLAAVCKTEVRPIDHLITDGNNSTTITLAYTEAVRAVGDAMIDTCFFFLVSDYIVADGSLRNSLKRMQHGASAIVVGNFQVAIEDALPWLEQKLASTKHTLALPPRELISWALDHLHPTALANTVNIPFSHNYHTNRLFWRVDGSTMIGRFYLMHMLCVRPEITDFVIGSSCDYSFVPEMCPSGNVEAITDSDEYLVVEMQPRNHELAFLRLGPLRHRPLAKSLSEWTTTVHRDNARHSIVFHADDVPSDIGRSIEQADTFVSEVARYLNRKPQPYRDHPYWRGALVAFYDATGRKFNDQEWRKALGLPVARDWLSQWLLWKARYSLMGRPPRVLPWHPYWPDFQTVFREISSFVTDPTQRMLMLSNEPTPLTLALADSGERVHRFRCMSFLQNTTERYALLHGRFDLCLLELTEGDMDLGDALIERIVPLMKPGGRIVVFVMNRRSLSNAREFVGSVSYHGTRFMCGGALLTEIKFVPSNDIRWAVRRGMAKLRQFTSASPALSVPAAVIGGGLLLCMSFIGNIDALRRSKRTAPRGIASSIVMRLIVDQRRRDRDRTRHSGEAAHGTEARSRHLVRLKGLPLIADAAKMREPQYDRCVELKNTIGLASLGLMTNQVWYDDPRRLGFLLARYKFVAKMLRGYRNAGEVGCGDAFGTRVVLQEVPDVTVYDFDPAFIEDIKARHDERWPLKAEIHDIVSSPLPRKHDALFSLDVLEHIATSDEHAYLANLRGSLASEGVLIIGTPSVESQTFASPLSKAGHINCKGGYELKIFLERYFTRVFLFSMNDEVVHTGFSPLAHYLFAICIGSR